MKIYLAIKYHADQRNRVAIEAISAELAAQGHTTVCIARDVEQWGAVTLSAAGLMQRSFAAILDADVVLVELTEKGVGLGIEAGYAYANTIPVVAIAQAGADISATLQGIATQPFFYTMYADLAQLSLPMRSSPTKILVFWGFIARSIDRLITCLAGMDAAELNWRPLPTANSLMILATHIVGNVEETILGLICGQPIQRDRAAEFQVADQDSVSIERRWHTLQAEIVHHLTQLSHSDVARVRLHPRRGELTGWEILVIVARHAAEHLAHAELTRDLLLAERASRP